MTRSASSSIVAVGAAVGEQVQAGVGAGGRGLRPRGEQLAEAVGPAPGRARQDAHGRVAVELEGRARRRGVRPRRLRGEGEDPLAVGGGDGVPAERLRRRGGGAAAAGALLAVGDRVDHQLGEVARVGLEHPRHGGADPLVDAAVRQRPALARGCATRRPAGRTRRSGRRR